MAVFRNDAHLQSAITSAIKIRQRIRSLDSELQQEIGFSPSVSIGINGGKMVAGNVGAKCVNRYDFTVIGDTVNVAARLQGIANPGEIIITEAAKNQMEDKFIFEDRGTKTLKGKAQQIHVFNVLR